MCGRAMLACTLCVFGCGRLGFDARFDAEHDANGDSHGGGIFALAQQAYVKASVTGANDQFGLPVALSADGSTLAVGAAFESSNATGIDGNQADNSALFAGAVYVFVRNADAWSQQAYIKASNTEAMDLFGNSLALSGDGSTLAIGAPLEDSSATGINGNQASNATTDSGAVYVFTRAGTAWTQQAYVKASNSGASDEFGAHLALSADGATLAVGAAEESSAATGVGGNQADNSALQAGAVYVFTRTGVVWTQQAYVKASNTGAGDHFGFSLALSGNGSRLAIGAIDEASAAIGVGGTQTDDSKLSAGAVYLFSRTGATWTQQTYVKASNTDAGDRFGYAVALSQDGGTLAVGADFEASAAIGVDGDQTDNSATLAGAVFVFVENGASWSQQAYIKASNTAATSEFGASLALSSDGSMLVVGAYEEDSSATGINGDQTDRSAMNAGAGYAFARTGSAWSETAYIKASNTSAGDQFGAGLALSADGSTLAVGANAEDSNASGIDGNQSDNTASEAGAVYVFR
jgi:HJR/Mrr/RecB family endonuclease